MIESIYNGKNFDTVNKSCDSLLTDPTHSVLYT